MAMMHDKATGCDVYTVLFERSDISPHRILRPMTIANSSIAKPGEQVLIQYFS